MSFTRRSTEGILDFVSVQTKHTGIPLLCYEEILICPFVLDYATLAINIYLLQHSHLKLDTIDRINNKFCGRKTDSSKSARSRHYYLAKWVIGIIKPIKYYIKIEVTLMTQNKYRGITLLSCFGQLFTSILNDRLTTYKLK